MQKNKNGHKAEATRDNPLGGCAYGNPNNMWSVGEYCNSIVDNNKLIQTTIHTPLKTAEAADAFVGSGTTTRF